MGAPRGKGKGGKGGGDAAEGGPGRHGRGGRGGDPAAAAVGGRGGRGDDAAATGAGGRGGKGLPAGASKTGVQIFLHKASPSQQEEFAKLKPGGVEKWLKTVFKLKWDLQMDVRRSKSTFQVAVEPTAAEEILSKVRDRLTLGGMPVRLGSWSGGQRGSPDQVLPPKERRDAPSDASDDVTKFWRRMQVAVQARNSSGLEQLKLHEPAHRVQWRACWSVAAAGARGGSCDVLLRVLLAAPAKADLAPPAADVVQVLCRIVACLGTQSEQERLQVRRTPSDVAVGHADRTLACYGRR